MAIVRNIETGAIEHCPFAWSLVDGTFYASADETCLKNNHCPFVEFDKGDDRHSKDIGFVDLYLKAGWISCE